jgi:dynein heavy chain
LLLLCLQDHRMNPLMEMIAKEIGEKVAKKIDLAKLFRLDSKQQMVTIDQARRVLEMWEGEYNKMRTKIEEQGNDNPWNFSRARLFDATIHMSKICKDLYEVAETMDQFRKFLGPELKSVTGEAEGIDEVSALVQGLTLRFLPPSSTVVLTLLFVVCRSQSSSTRLRTCRSTSLT